ncbi:SDR family NAD(P)-dependent oxidoreductase [Patescibacteria group bacterium]|nr:SDR family NAD(P)-dependent oxidoreductase [Patescibacteria group bacterium]
MNKSRGYYFGHYDVSAEKYFGADFSRKCFVFPGQGSAFPGMFKEQYFAFSVIREKFIKADFLAGKYKLQKISDYILRPENIKKEVLPIIRNLALFTLETALYELFVSQKIIPEIVTGHSYGEYAALVASGIISFEEMFDIVYHRDFFCPPANSLGFMIAVSAGEKEIKKILGKGEYYFSNFNGPRQTVISVSAEKRNEISRLLEKGGVNYKILSDVPQPYHSPYLNGAKDKVEKYLQGKKIIFKKPKIPLFSSVTKRLIDENNFSEKEIRYILINQITTPVDFMKQILSVYDSGCFNFVEVGPKKVFSRLVEDILADKEVKTGFAPDLLGEQKHEKKIVSAPASRKKNTLFSLVSKTIGKITGYEIEKISFEDRYQEDLGIDSIKKAEILLTVMKESDISPGEDFNTSAFRSVKDTVVYLEKGGKTEKIGKKIFVKKESVFGRYVAVWKPKHLESCFAAFKGKKRKNVIIFPKEPEFEFNNISPRVFRFFKSFRRFLKSTKKDDFNLVLLSQGKINPYICGYASFLKSVKKELPGIFFKHIHFDEDNKSKKDMFKIIEEEMRQPGEIDVLYKGGKRFVLSTELIKDKNRKAELDEKSVIVALGGAKGITFSLIKDISRLYKPVIYLAGRSAKEDKLVKENIEELIKNNHKIYYESLDAADINSLEKLFSKIKKKHGKIDLIINGAGVVRVSFLKDKTDEDINYEFKNKVLPAFNVLKLSLKYGPKRIINFSSLVSLYGSAGQSIYTCANEMISEMTKKYNSARKSSDSSALTIHWPGWEGVGMTRQQGVLQRLKESGASLINSRQAGKLFLSDIAPSKPDSVYCMDKFDPLAYGFALNNFGEYGVLIGKMANPFDISVSSNIIFEKIFDLAEDKYLNDHKIDGVSYVPAAVGVAMFLCLGRIYFGEFPVLENIAIRNPIAVRDRFFKCSLEAEKSGDSCLFAVKSSGAIHFLSKAKKNQNKKAATRSAKKPSGKILTDKLYSDPRFKEGVYLGPTFQCIDKVFSGNIFGIDNSKLLPVLGCGLYDKLILWIDGSFQALAVASLKPKQRGRKFIPSEISEIRTFFSNKISDYLYLVPRITKSTAGRLEGDVDVLNERGEKILALKGVCLKIIKNL